MKFTIILVILLVAKCVSSEKILFYWGVSGYSHRISVWPLVEKLVEKGHNITFFSPLPPKKQNPDVTEITPENLLDDVGLGLDFLKLRVTKGSLGVQQLWSQYFNFGISHCNSVFRNQELVNWINDASYDLVIINAMFNDCAYGLAHKFKAPYIIYSTVAGFGWLSESYGYPDENYPEFRYHYPLDMSFMDRVWNSLQPLYWNWNRNYYMFPIIEQTLRKGLKLNDIPSLSEMEQNASLVFVNSNTAEEHPRSLPPLFVQIGGMHCVDSITPLPEDIEEFVKSGDEGFIYFSFGTFAKAGSLPQNIRDMIFGAMKKFNLQFLVKWDGDYPDGLPKNVKVVHWVSQQDVLAHPKIRAFISHGGLLGTQESAFHGVPMIIIPIFADQDYNADRVSSRKRGIKLEISELTEKQLEDAIREIIINKIYMENSKKVSRLFKDQPIKPVDTAVWWVDYVLRNKDTSHLRPIGMTKNWYQRRMLDIWGFLVIGVFGAFILICLGFCYFLRGFSKPVHSIKKTN